MYTKHTLLLHLSIFMVMSLAREAHCGALYAHHFKREQWYS